MGSAAAAPTRSNRGCEHDGYHVGQVSRLLNGTFGKLRKLPFSLSLTVDIKKFLAERGSKGCALPVGDVLRLTQILSALPARENFGTTSVQLRERKNGVLAPKRHQVKQLEFGP
jgi:hypothetical protein